MSGTTFTHVVSRTSLDRTWEILDSGIANPSKTVPDCPLEFPGTSSHIVKAASIDAIFNFSMHNSGYFSLQTAGVAVYKDYQDPFVPSLEGSPYNFVCHGKLADCSFLIEYLQWRRPYCLGYWYTSKEELEEVRETKNYQDLFSAPARCYANSKRKNSASPDFIYYSQPSLYDGEVVSSRGTVMIRVDPTTVTEKELGILNDAVKGYQKYWVYSPITEHCTILQGMVRPIGYCYLIMQNPGQPLYNHPITKSDLVEESTYSYRKAVEKEISSAIWAGIIPYWGLGPISSRFL